MVRKVILGTLLVGLIGILAVGAVIRTADRTGLVAEARGLEEGQGYGRGRSDEAKAGQGAEAGHGAASRGAARLGAAPYAATSRGARRSGGFGDSDAP